MQTLYDDEPDDNRAHVCPECGRKKPREYTHRMDVSKVRVLRSIAERHKRGAEWVHVHRDGALICDPDREIQDDVHAMRLMWFGLVERRGHRTGLYRVTELGWKYLTGEATVPERIVCQGGRVLQRSDETTNIKDAIGTVLDKAYWDSYAKGLTT